MKAAVRFLLTLTIGFAPIVLASPTGIFRASHDLGFGDQSSLDPASKGRIMHITDKIMSRLVRPSLVDGTPSPDLAVSWESNADATEWTFNLRKGVTFHDGSDFDANDVVYTINRILDPELDSPAKSAVKMVSKAIAVNKHTVKLILNGTFVDLPLSFVDYRLRMIPEGSGDTIATTGVGTGPFKIEKFDPFGKTVMSAFMDYYEGPPKLAGIESTGIPDGQARFQALLGGQVDMERGLKAPQKIMLEKSPKHSVQSVLTGNWRGIVFRVDKSPFDDVRVRKALRLVADRKEMVDVVMKGNATISCDTPAAPNDQYRATMECPQDIDSAKALLAQAGYEDGIKIDVHVSTVEPTWSEIAQVYQQQAAKAGIEVNIVQVPSDGYWNAVWRNKPVSMTRWNQRPADQILHEAYLGGAPWNDAYFNDKAFDSMLASARQELDFTKRRNLYVKAQEHLFEVAGTLIPYHVSRLVGLTSRVKGLDAVPEFSIQWHKVSVSQ